MKHLVFISTDFIPVLHIIMRIVSIVIENEYLDHKQLESRVRYRVKMLHMSKFKDFTSFFMFKVWVYLRYGKGILNPMLSLLYKTVNRENHGWCGVLLSSLNGYSVTDF